MLEILRKLGPGLLYAGAAIGVSHIVQSTRAGAEYGYVLILGILFAHLFKYPFFELGPRYAALKGESLIQAYLRLGRWAVWIVLILTVSTMFTIQAAVTVVTAGIALKITGLSWSPWVMSTFLLVLCALILYIGKFNVLNELMKVIMIVLAITTVVAAVTSFFIEREVQLEAQRFFSLQDPQDASFLIAFLGWMPAPLDIAIWHSLWVVANRRIRNSEIPFRQEMTDFRVGFYGTAFLALCFLLLGANVIYGSGIELSANGVVYAGQLIDIYTTSIGSWSYFVIAIAAFTTMFSTTLTCLDGSPRVITEILRGHLSEKDNPQVVLQKRNMHFTIMILLTIGVAVLLSVFVSSMKQMVTIATSISFLTAPILAYLSIRVARTELTERPWSRKLEYLAWLGLFFLIVLGAYYLRILIG
ncbi:MAG: divalent metal cation transporter [Flavobacteriales bacterium]|nr:divalent metal cation transporter [Flavobacteriales bacterium]